MIEVTFKAESMAGVFDAMREALDMPKTVTKDVVEEKPAPKKKEESVTL
ncbi:TPA: hypothetical protein VJG71_000742, partial [Streptococcus pyogenes]|nr:hypothetical protein [Streptococcus pyogenes]